MPLDNDDSLNRAIVVLDDGSTYGGEEGAHIVFLSPLGEEELDNSGDFKNVSRDNILYKISVADLVNFWLKHNRDEEL